MRKSSVTSRSSLPSGAEPCQTTSVNFCWLSPPKSLPCTPCRVPSRCLRKYSWPLPLEPRRLERHTNRLRGQFSGLSGSSQDIFRLPDLIPATVYSTASLPSFSASLVICSGFLSSCGAEGSQPMRSERALQSISVPAHFDLSASGDRISLSCN